MYSRMFHLRPRAMFGLLCRRVTSLANKKGGVSDNGRGEEGDPVCRICFEQREIEDDGRVSDGLEMVHNGE